MTEGDTKKCGQCGIEITHVKIIDTFGNRNTEKLQWQTNSTKKPHFKFAGEKDGKTIFKCITPEQIVQESMEATDAAEELEVQAPSNTITPKSPFDEAELIVRWARERAYKITMAEVTDINKLSVQEKSGLGQAQGMLTRALVDTTIELMKINGMKSGYGKND